MNKVISGDYIGSAIEVGSGKAYIVINNLSFLYLGKSTLSHYKVEEKNSHMSAPHCIIKALVLALILWLAIYPPLGRTAGIIASCIGALSGILTSRPIKEYIISVKFTDGHASRLEIDQKIYNSIVSELN